MLAYVLPAFLSLGLVCCPASFFKLYFILSRRFSECLKALGHLEVATKSYGKVVEMAPLHLEARLALSTLQQQLGRPDSALEALEPMYDPDTLAQDSSAAQQVRFPPRSRPRARLETHPTLTLSRRVFQELKLLLHRSTLLRSQGRTDDYVDTLLTMLSMLLKVCLSCFPHFVRKIFF